MLTGSELAAVTKVPFTDPIFRWIGLNDYRDVARDITADQRPHLCMVLPMKEPVLDFRSIFCDIISLLIVINRDESSRFQR